MMKKNKILHILLILLLIITYSPQNLLFGENPENSTNPLSTEQDEFDLLDRIDEENRKESNKNLQWKQARADKLDIIQKKVRKDIKIKGLLESKTPTFQEIWELEAGLHISPIIPMDDLLPSFGIGIGGNFFASIIFPLLPNSRIGTSIGYARMNSKISYFQATLTLIPIVAYYEIFYIFSNNLRPYFRLGTGGTYSAYKGKPIANENYNSISSFDATLDVGTGLGYRTKFFSNLELLLYLNYFRAFEKKSNSFFVLSLGTNIIF